MSTTIRYLFALVLTWAWCSTAIAALSVDIMFDDPGEPALEGFAGDGTANPTTNIAGGVWTNNLPGGQYALFDGNTGGAIGTIEGPVFHGWAEITVTSWSSNRDDQRVFAHGDPATGGVVYFRDGEMVFHASGGDTDQSVPVANQDGQKHSYGWEHDRTNQVIKLFFDGLPVGNPLGYDASTGSYSGDMWFGDGTGGEAHNEVWDRVVMAEGPFQIIPEPSSVMLLGLGGLALMTLAWKKRRRHRA